MTKLIITTSLLLAVLACGPTDKADHANHTMSTSQASTPIEAAEKEVFVIHDEAMPRIDEIMKLKKELNGKMAALDSLKGTPTETVRAGEKKAEMRRLVVRLSEADSLMMDWMARYNGDTLKKLPEADALRYLAEQKQLISNAKTKINQSIGQATTYLKQ